MRSLGIFGLGLLLGGLLGYALYRPRGLAASREASERQPRLSQSAASAKDSASAQQKSEDEKVLLGDIAAVPFQELYETLSRQSPEKIARLAEQLDNLPRNPQNEARIRAFFQAWAHLDSSAAFESATALHSAEARATAIGATVNGADPGAIGAIATSISELPNEALSSSARFGLFDQAVEKWSEVDPAAAARLLGETKMEGMRMTAAFYAVAQNWAANDPEAALAWAQKQNQVPFGLNPINGAVLGWRKKDPAAAEAYTLSQIGTPLGKQLITNVVGQMATEDRAKAAAWVGNLPDAELRNQTYGALASQLAFSDPKTASAWALTLPPDAMPDAVGSTISIWARSDPTAAARWMEGLTGSVRDSAVSSYSYTVAETDPAAAMAWAVTISDEQKRASAARRAASQWLERDPSAARAWIQDSSLGEAEKARLLASPAPSP